MSEDLIHAGNANDGTYTPQPHLMAGDRDECGWVDFKGTLLSGQNIVRGTLLGAITSGGKLVKSLSASSDGSQVPIGVALHDCDASSADQEIMYRKTGVFNTAALVFGASHTASSLRAALEDRSIYLRP